MLSFQDLGGKKQKKPNKTPPTTQHKKKSLHILIRTSAIITILLTEGVSTQPSWLNPVPPHPWSLPVSEQRQ